MNEYLLAMCRRPLLTGVVGGLAALAGCSSLFSDTSPEGGSQNTTGNKSDTPNLPYRAENNSENVDMPVGAKLDNATTDATYVTLVVSKAKPPAPGGESAFAAPTEFEAGETLFTKSTEIPGASAETFYGLIAARGVYHIAVHVKDGLRGTVGSVVPGPGPTIQIRKQTVDAVGRPLVRWTSGRAPFPAEGEAKELPYAGPDPRCGRRNRRQGDPRLCGRITRRIGGSRFASGSRTARRQCSTIATPFRRTSVSRSCPSAPRARSRSRSARGRRRRRSSGGRNGGGRSRSALTAVRRELAATPNSCSARFG